jgi:hypothetical protein
MRKHLDRTNDAETKIKYFVEVDRREEKGEIKTIKFQKRQPPSISPSVRKLGS